MSTHFIAALVIAYLLGSISFAVVVSRFVGLADPRTYGSKNPGATNVLRSGNKVAALLTLLGDALKGTVAVLLAYHYQDTYQFTQSDIAWVGLAAFIGHLFPIFFRFEGGKGVATALGVLLALNWVLGLATAVTWLIIAYFFRYSSLAALVASVFAVFYDVLLFGINGQALAVFIMAALLVYRHKLNIANLIAGKESKIGQKKAEAKH
ncbi:MAG: glycerol-3-phosphate 1-O-acyltransferase PlsY [Limnobacter sp.]|uniref:glycerol-3-phosphate 1-O-acyltransferase PlsY n=1 Tax=Limnobacter sp. TaxID=2003368 RepID=UPI00391CB19F